MQTNIWQKTLATMTVAGLMMTGFTGRAQSNAPAPQLSFGVQQVMQLEQAKISDDVVMAYIKSSANSYGLTADQIIYLRQQEFPNPVIAAMLNSTAASSTAMVAATTAPAAPQPAAPAPAATTTYVQPATTYVQTVPTTTYYYSQPDYYPAYYPAYGYGWYPPVSLSFGWGWHGGWGGGWHGGGRGGWHR